MATLGMTSVLLLLIIMGLAAVTLQRIATKRALEQWSRTYGVDIISYEILARPRASGHGYSPVTSGKVQITYRRRGEHEFVECVVGWHPGLFGSRIDPPPRRYERRLGTRAHEGAPALGPATDGSVERGAFSNDSWAPAPATFDDRARAEVARRLDAITSQPGWAKDHDLDGSGHIDSEEWEALRQSIEHEVRAELARAAEEAPGGDGAPPRAGDSWQGGGW